jgi:hypothetical protein
MSQVSISAAPAIVPQHVDGVSSSFKTAITDLNLLTPPKSNVDPDDALAGFLVLEAMSRGVGFEAAIKNVNELRKQKQAEWEKQKAALMEAMKAKEHSSFWGKVG